MPSKQLAFPQAQCADCPIRHRAVCARCETDELEKLEAIKYYRSYEAGQTIVWAGDSMDFVASVVRGCRAPSRRRWRMGRRQMVGPPSSIGFPRPPESRIGALRRDRDDGSAAVLFSPDAFPRIDGRNAAHRASAPRDDARRTGRRAGVDAASGAQDRTRENREFPVDHRAPATRRLSGYGGMGEVAFDLPLTREAMADYLGPDAGDGEPADVGTEEGTVSSVSRGKPPHRDPGFRHSCSTKRADDSDGGILS